MTRQAAHARILPPDPLAFDGACEGRTAVREGSGLMSGDTIVIEHMDMEVRIDVPVDLHYFANDGSGAWMPDILLPPGTMPHIEPFIGGTVPVAPPPGVSPGDRAYEQIRTAMLRAYPTGIVNAAREYDESVLGPITTMKNLVYTGTFAAFALSGGTAAMVVAGSILARRRAFALLRMSGCSLDVLRQTVMAEATLPLLLVSAISASTALAVSAMLIWNLGEGSVLPPPDFVLPLLGGLALGPTLPLMTLPLLGSVTRSEQTRFD